MTCLLMYGSAGSDTRQFLVQRQAMRGVGVQRSDSCLKARTGASRWPPGGVRPAPAAHPAAAPNRFPKQQTGRAPLKGKSVTLRVDMGGPRIIKKKQHNVRILKSLQKQYMTRDTKSDKNL